MRQEFKSGQCVQQICFPDEAMICIGCERQGQTVGKIVVVMENGQMAGVPWFAVISDEGEMISKWNAATVEGVIYGDESPLL